MFRSVGCSDSRATDVTPLVFGERCETELRHGVRTKPHGSVSRNRRCLAQSPRMTVRQDVLEPATTEKRVAMHSLALHAEFLRHAS
jgi:hypothetical protein